MAKFNKGDIVYWHRQEGNRHSVAWGMVDEQFSDAVLVDILEHKENRLINGVPIDEFRSETKYKKLPKGWTYNTQLFEMTYLDIADERMKKHINSKIDNPIDIKLMYDEGLLVKADTKFHGRVEAEVSDNGYRIVKKYPMWEKQPLLHASIRPDKCYFTYEEAKAEVDTYEQELIRISKLTDEEWSIEEIDKMLNRCLYTPDERAKYRKWLLGLNNIVEVETRCWSGEIQWKYEKNKKWNNIEL